MSTSTPGSTAAVRLELLVRCLEAWAPAAVHRARRAVYAHSHAAADGGRAAEAAVRVFADLPDLARGRELTALAVGAGAVAIGPQLADAAAGAASGLAVHPVDGNPDECLPIALKAAGVRGVPVFGYLDSSGSGEPPALSTVAAIGAGRPAAVLLVLGTGGRSGGDLGRDPATTWRATLTQAGFPLVSAVEMVSGDAAAGDLVLFGATAGKSLEAFKEALWAVDEYAGVRYRDPGDPERHLLDISLNPHPGPLRRELLRRLAEVGEATVAELRTFTLTHTAYRAADATRVLGALVAAGAVARHPEGGRLGGDVVITGS